MHVFQTFKHLVYNVLLMNVLEDIRTNYSVQVRVHKVEN